MREPSASTTNTPPGGWANIICEPSFDHCGIELCWAKPSSSMGACKLVQGDTVDPISATPITANATVFSAFLSLVQRFLEPFAMLVREVI